MTGDLDTTEVIDSLLPALHTDTRANLYFWTEADLIQWMDEALKRLARKACVFVERSTALNSVKGQAVYNLPDAHEATLHVSYISTPLRAAGTIELEGRNPQYQTAPGTPDHWYEGLQGDYTIGVTPVPVENGDAIPLICAVYPPDLDTAKVNTLVTAPYPLKGYLEMSVLAAAYGREGESEMQDLAQHCRSRADMYEQMFAQYYGKAV
jgi:hypothetical protein